jgi:hypothetical protein
MVDDTVLGVTVGDYVNATGPGYVDRLDEARLAPRRKKDLGAYVDDSKRQLKGSLDDRAVFVTAKLPLIIGERDALAIVTHDLDGSIDGTPLIRWCWILGEVSDDLGLLDLGRGAFKQSANPFVNGSAVDQRGVLHMSLALEIEIRLCTAVAG